MNHFFDVWDEFLGSWIMNGNINDRLVTEKHCKNENSAFFLEQKADVTCFLTWCLSPFLVDRAIFSQV
jgi:hypothetical protein